MAKQEHLECTELRQGEFGPDSESGSEVRILTPDWMTSKIQRELILVRRYVYDKIFTKIRSLFFQIYEPNCGKKCPVSQC